MVSVSSQGAIGDLADEKIHSEQTLTSLAPSPDMLLT
jgi:hypothetical protein